MASPAARLVLGALVVSAAGCASRATDIEPAGAPSGATAAERKAEPAAAERPVAADPFFAVPHEFGFVSSIEMRNDGTLRPDYVLVRIVRGDPHGSEELPQPVFEPQLVCAQSEGAGVGGYGAVHVGDSIELDSSLRLISMRRIDWPVGHDPDGRSAPEPLDLGTEPGRDDKPFEYRMHAGMNRAGEDAVDLTFHFETRSENRLLREVPTRTVRVRYGQSVLFTTRRPD